MGKENQTYPKKKGGQLYCRRAISYPYFVQQTGWLQAASRGEAAMEENQEVMLMQWNTSTLNSVNIAVLPRVLALRDVTGLVKVEEVVNILLAVGRRAWQMLPADSILHLPPSSSA